MGDSNVFSLEMGSFAKFLLEYWFLSQGGANGSCLPWLTLIFSMSKKIF